MDKSGAVYTRRSTVIGIGITGEMGLPRVTQVHLIIVLWRQSYENDHISQFPPENSGLTLAFVLITPVFMLKSVFIWMINDPLVIPYPNRTKDKVS